MDYRMQAPLAPADMGVLRAGDVVYLSGTIYTARDAAHARFSELLKNGEPLPVPKGACIYYCGPCPAAPGEMADDAIHLIRALVLETVDVLGFSLGGFVAQDIAQHFGIDQLANAVADRFGRMIAAAARAKLLIQPR